MKQEEITSKKYEKYSYDISQEFSNQIDAFTKKEKMTAAELMYSAWGILLMEYTNSTDVVFGTTVSGRNAKIKGIEDAVGLFINTLPLRMENHENKNVLQLLEDVKKSVRERELYETSPLVDIKTYVGISGKKNYLIHW